MRKWTRHASAPGGQGLTLPELVIALAIMAIVASIVTPAMQALIERAQLRAAAQALSEDLRWTRSETIQRNAPLIASFSTAGEWCWGITARTMACDCHSAPSAANGCELKRQQGGRFRGIALNLPPGFTHSRFQPRRATADNGSLTLTAPSGTALRIVLSRLGRVRICALDANRSLGYWPCQ